MKIIYLSNIYWLLLTQVRNLSQSICMILVCFCPRVRTRFSTLVCMSNFVRTDPSSRVTNARRPVDTFVNSCAWSLTCWRTAANSLTTCDNCFVCFSISFWRVKQWVHDPPAPVLGFSAGASVFTLRRRLLFLSDLDTLLERRLVVVVILTSISISVLPLVMGNFWLNNLRTFLGTPPLLASLRISSPRSLTLMHCPSLVIVLRFKTMMFPWIRFLYEESFFSLV